MKKKIILFTLLFCLSVTFFLNSYICYSSGNEIVREPKLYSRYIAVTDAKNNRLLYGKNENSPAAMASTTKIMTLIIALEYGNLEHTITVSEYAASMPKVKLNIHKGEQFLLKDLLYSLMLESHNDSAVAIAENIGLYYLNKTKAKSDTKEMETILSNADEETSKKYVDIFINLMNKKAEELELSDTFFITPNGLDAENDNNYHHSTAKDLAIIMSYCINNETFKEITRTKSYSFSNIKGKSYAVNNTNALLNSLPGIISGKTGFTSKAGYCYVCAYSYNDDIIIISLLNCGYPPNKTYKWKDVHSLIEYIKKIYDKKESIDGLLSFYIPFNKNNNHLVRINFNINVNYLCNNDDIIDVDMTIPEYYTQIFNSKDINTISNCYFKLFINEDMIYLSNPKFVNDN